MVTMTTSAPDAAGEVDTDGAAPGVAALGPELAALQRQADELEGTGPDAQRQALADSTTAADLRQALDLVRTMGRPLFSDWPDYGVSVWNDAQLAAIATSGGAIMDRHGWTMGELFSQWGPYIALLGAALPPGLATWQHLRIRKAIAAQRARDRPPAGSGPPEDADGVRP